MLETKTLQERINQLEVENAELKNQIKTLELFYQREIEQSSLTLKSNITKSVRICRDDWEDFKDCEVNEDNLLSLHIIISKIFKALRRNGIDV